MEHPQVPMTGPGGYGVDAYPWVRGSIDDIPEEYAIKCVMAYNAVMGMEHKAAEPDTHGLQGGGHCHIKDNGDITISYRMRDLTIPAEALEQLQAACKVAIAKRGNSNYQRDGGTPRPDRDGWTPRS